MKSLIIFFPVFLLFHSTAATLDSAKAARRLSTIELLYKKGVYHDCIQNAITFQKAQHSSVSKLRAALWQAKANVAIMEFDKAKFLVAAAEAACVAMPDQRTAKLWLADYYVETGEINLAFALLEREQNFTTHQEQLEWNLLKVQVAIERAEMRKATQYLLSAKELLSKILNPEEQIHYTARWNNLYDYRLLKNGTLAEAKSSMQTHLNWYNGIAKGENELHSQLLEYVGDYCIQREDFNEGIRRYLQAYSMLTSSDYQLRKIFLLTKLSALSALVDQRTDYAAYQRRLQLHAGRSIYQRNLFQLGYKISEAHAYFADHRYAESQAMVAQLQQQYKLPAQHPFTRIMQELVQRTLLDQMAHKKFVAYTDSAAKALKLVNGTSVPLYKLNLTLLALQIESGENIDQAEVLLRSMIDTMRLSVDSVSEIYFFAKRQLAKALLAQGKVKETFSIAMHLRDEAEILFGKESWEYIENESSLAEYAYWAGAYSYSVSFMQTITGCERNLKVLQNKKQLDLFYCRVSALAGLLGDEKKRAEYGQKIKRKSIATGFYHLPAELTILELSAELHAEVATFFVAEKLFNHAFQQRNSRLGKEHGSLLRDLNGQAMIALRNGELGVADQKISQYIALARHLYGDSSLQVATGYESQASYFLAIGDSYAAKNILELCIQIKTRLLGASHLSLVQNYISLAQLENQDEKLNFAAAELLYTQAGSIIATTIGTQSLTYYRFLLSYAEFQLTGKKYELARKNLALVEQYLKDVQSSGLLNAELQVQLGQWNYATDNFSEARKYYSAAAELYQTIFSKKHPLYCHAYSLEAKSMYMLGQESDAMNHMKSIIPVYLEFIEQHFPSLSFDEKSRYWYAMKEQFDFFNFMCVSSKQSSPEQNALVYNNILATKALLLASDIKLRKQIAESGDSILVNLFYDWISTKQELVLALSLKKEEQKSYGVDPDKIQEEVTLLEKSMSSRSNLFEKNNSSKRYDWNSVRQELQANEYAVEIIRCRYFNKSFTDSIFYTGLILSSGEKKGPLKVLLADGNKMESRYFKYYQNSIQYNATDEYGYAAYWSPFRSVIPANSVVYLSTDGVYNQINVELLFNLATGQYVFDENKIVQVSNSKDLIRSNMMPQATKKGEYILCGNPLFYLSKDADFQISQLPGTEMEVAGIKKILEKNLVSVSSKVNAEVTEEYLGSLKSPVVLHIATHGYFYENKSVKSNRGIANPMLYSGLLLTGAGDILNGKRYSFVNSRTGILTAYEAVNMSLDGTEMVVLSACETGKGAVLEGEGVMGLQRSFLVAGSGCVVVSMFKVSDEITNELMQEFYSFWLGGNTKREALRNAKLKIKQRYPAPKYWGSFIMIEGKSESTNPIK